MANLFGENKNVSIVHTFSWYRVGCSEFINRFVRQIMKLTNSFIKLYRLADKEVVIIKKYS